MGLNTGVLLTMALTETVGAIGDNATEPNEVLLFLFCLDDQGPAVTEVIKSDTMAAAMLPVEKVGDGAGVAGDRATPSVPAEVAAAGSVDGEVKDGDAAGEAEMAGDGRGDAAMLAGVLETDAVAGDWGDIGGKVGDEAGLSGGCCDRGRGCCDRGGGCSKGARGRGNWAGSSSCGRCPCGAGGCWSSSWQ